MSNDHDPSTDPNPNPITVFACPPHCSAGGPISDGGHKFDLELTHYLCESDDVCGNRWSDRLSAVFTCPNCGARAHETGWTKSCVCGMTAMDWSMFHQTADAHEHRMVRNVRGYVTCSECSEGANYLFGRPGSKDAVALGCRCLTTTSRYCRLHTPEAELEVEVELRPGGE